MSSYIAIHTSASLEAAKSLAKPYHGKVRVHPGQAAFGQPDCFYGWGEAHMDGGCIRHTILITSDYQAIRDIARHLVADGWQCYVTDAEDFSVPYRGVTASLYRDEHEH